MQSVVNRAARALGIELPIVQAPMSFIAGHALAAAVSAAGGLGVIGPNAGKRAGEEISAAGCLAREFERLRRLTDKPAAASVVLPEGDNAALLARARSLVEEAARAGACAIVCVGGLQPEIFSRIRELGMKLIVRPLTPTVRLAQQAQALGADVFVATGSDAAGVLPQQPIGTFSIVPVIA